MKIRITMKDPDTLWDAIEDALKELEIEGVSEEELEEIKETRKEQIRKDCSTWFEYGEYLTVVVDTEAKTCVVIPVSSN